MMGDVGTLHVRDEGRGRSLLLVHGLLTNGDLFEAVVGRLARGHRVLVPDLRGFGRSGDLPPPDTVEQHARDLAGLLEARSAAPAIVLGYSQGGAVVQQLVLDHPRVVGALILCCTFAHNPSTWREKLEGVATPWLVRWLGAGTVAGQARGLSVDQRRALEGMIVSSRRDRMAAATREMLRFDSRARLREIACPTLVVAGARDAAVPLHHARMLARAIAGAQVQVVEGAGHELIWTHGGELIDAVEAFSAATDGPRAVSP